jgi:hypothetical protein
MSIEQLIADLKVKLPRANVRNRVMTGEQKQAELAELKRINEKWNHAPVLGGGLLKYKPKIQG